MPTTAIPLILASSSPRRRELLDRLGLAFVVQPSSEEESVPAGTPPRAMVEMLAERKARSISREHDQGLIIGSDTIVVLDGEVLGKPKDAQDAFRMLSGLQGRTHTVYTGVAVIDAARGRSSVRSSSTEVRIKPLSADRIERYIATGEPNDKAGAYGIQGLGATLVQEIHGDYFTVVGLPVGLLSDMLAEFGVHVM